MIMNSRTTLPHQVGPTSLGKSSITLQLSRIIQLSVGAALLMLATPVFTQTAPDLGSLLPYAVVSQTFTNTTLATSVDGYVCYTTGPAVNQDITGVVVTPCPEQTGVEQDEARAVQYAQSCTSIGAAVALDTITVGGGLPGVFPPGCYSSTGAMTISTGAVVTLSGDGVYIFRAGGSLDAAADSRVSATAGACTDNVFWAPGGGTTIGARAAFVGNVFRGTAAGLSITLGDLASMEGRAMAFGSTVTTANNAIAAPEECPEFGAIIVEKRTSPTGSPQSFTFTGDAAGSLVDAGQIVVADLAPGNYSLTESALAGWELTSIVCNAANSSGDIGTATANFALEAGEAVACVFLNTELTATGGTITILKQASPPGTGASFDFGGDLGNFSLANGDLNVGTLAPGIYRVNEIVPDDWLLTSASCSNGSPVDAIAVGARENVICTFVNTLRMAPINVPIFTAGGIAIMALLLMLVATLFPGYFASVGRR